MVGRRRTSGAKARAFLALGGTTEVVPFPKRFMGWRLGKYNEIVEAVP